MHCLHDRNNHAPDATPQDEWGDFHELSPFPGRSTAPIPQRRNLGRGIEPSRQPALEMGVNIGSAPLAPVRNDSPGQLEIREMNADVLRLEGDAMIPNRPERKVVFRPRPARQKPDRATAGESRHWGEQRSKSLRWMWVGGGCVVATVCVALAVQPLLVKPSSTGGTAVVSKVLDEEIPAGVEAVNRLVSRRSEAETIFSRYAKSSCPDDFLPWVRDGVGLTGLIRKHGKSISVPPDWHPSADFVWDVFDSQGSPCATLDGTLPGYQRFSACFVVSGGKLLLDWKATTGYGTASFQQLSMGAGDASEIRGWIKPDNYHTADFPESEFAAYQLLSPGNANDAPVWCYARRGGAEDADLAAIFPDGEVLKHSDTPAKVTVALQRGGPSSRPNQWLLVKLLHNHWISP